MLRTRNATALIPTSRTTSATGSYSSQCLLCTLMLHLAEKNPATDATRDGVLVLGPLPPRPRRQPRGCRQRINLGSPARQMGRAPRPATRLNQCPNRSESDRSAALPRLQRGKTQGLFDHFGGVARAGWMRPVPKDGRPKNTLSAFCLITA